MRATQPAERNARALWIDNWARRIGHRLSGPGIASQSPYEQHSRIPISIAQETTITFLPVLMQESSRYLMVKVAAYNRRQHDSITMPFTLHLKLSLCHPLKREIVESLESSYCGLRNDSFLV